MQGSCMRPCQQQRKGRWERVCASICVQHITMIQGLLEYKVHRAVKAYSRPMPMRLGPPYERCGTLCLRNHCRLPLGPLGFEGAQHRQTLRPSRRRDPQQSPASFRLAVKDLEDPAVQCRWPAVSVSRVALNAGMTKNPSCECRRVAREKT